LAALDLKGSLYVIDKPTQLKVKVRLMTAEVRNRAMISVLWQVTSQNKPKLVCFIFNSYN